jgi:hypothetical protein
MGEHGQPIFDNVFVQQDAGLGIAHQARERGVALKKRAIAQIPAIMLNQVEGVEDRGLSGLTTGQLLNRNKLSGPSTTGSPSIVAVGLDQLGGSRDRRVGIGLFDDADPFRRRTLHRIDVP